MRLIRKNVCIIILLIMTGSRLHPLHSREVKTGVYQNYPKVFLDEYGHPDGIFIDILEAIERKKGGISHT